MWQSKGSKSGDVSCHTQLIDEVSKELKVVKVNLEANFPLSHTHEGYDGGFLTHFR